MEFLLDMQEEYAGLRLQQVSYDLYRSSMQQLVYRLNLGGVCLSAAVGNTP
jgi:hypothetical protein